MTFLTTLAAASPAFPRVLASVTDGAADAAVVHVRGLRIDIKRDEEIVTVTARPASRHGVDIMVEAQIGADLTSQFVQFSADHDRIDAILGHAGITGFDDLKTGGVGRLPLRALMGALADRLPKALAPLLDAEVAFQSIGGGGGGHEAEFEFVVQDTRPKSAKRIAHEARNDDAKAAATDRRAARTAAHAERNEAMALAGENRRALRIVNHMIANRDLAIAAAQARGEDINTPETRIAFYDRVRAAVAANDDAPTATSLAA